jgi:hypothetical protein
MSHQYEPHDSTILESLRLSNKIPAELENYISNKFNKASKHSKKLKTIKNYESKPIHKERFSSRRAGNR